MVLLVAPHVREYGAIHEALHVDYLLTPPLSATTRNAQQQQQQPEQIQVMNITRGLSVAMMIIISVT